MEHTDEWEWLVFSYFFPFLSLFFPQVSPGQYVVNTIPDALFVMNGDLSELGLNSLPLEIPDEKDKKEFVSISNYFKEILNTIDFP